MPSIFIIRIIYYCIAEIVVKMLPANPTLHGTVARFVMVLIAELSVCPATSTKMRSNVATRTECSALLSLRWNHMEG